MPYIPRADRGRAAFSPTTPGELNYSLTERVLLYLKAAGHHYSSYNEVIGVLECLKLELYRRMVAPYEDYKRVENGEVYPDVG